jgi:(4S)-4-hydroxy-5-phosphonooxypentane-2,3-dione isomerase
VPRHLPPARCSSAQKVDRIPSPHGHVGHGSMDSQFDRVRVYIPLSRAGKQGQIDGEVQLAWKWKMLIVHVQVRVKSESIKAFREATIENARQSVQEPGIARFDLLQDSSDPARFLLVEVYRNSEAPGQHKATAHYAAWRDAVADMMAEPRASVKYENIFPGDEGW